MEEEKLTENIDIRVNKYSKNGFDYYCRNSYGKFHIPMDHLTPEDLRSIADHLENNPPLKRDSTSKRSSTAIMDVRQMFKELRNLEKK